MAIDAEHPLSQAGIRVGCRHLNRRPAGQEEGSVQVVLRLLAQGLYERELRNGKGRGDPGLLEENQAVAGPDYPILSDLISQSQPRAKVAAFEFARGVRKIQNLCVEVEDSALIADLWGEKSQGGGGPYIE